MGRWKVGVCLAVSGAAFGVLASEALLHSDLDGLLGPSPARADIAAVVEPMAEPILERPAVALAEPELVLPETETEDAEVPSDWIPAPDLTETTALAALRRARRAGFVVEIHDPDGNRVAASERRFMRVRDGDQSPAPGTLVAPGATFELTAEYPRAYAAGY